MPFVIIAGLFYFLVRFLIDCHLLLNLFKNEIDSSGELIHNICLKVIFLLCFYQFCIFVKILAQGDYPSALVLFVMLVFTIIVYALYNKKFLRTELFVDEDYNFEEMYLREWYEKYSHPMEQLNNAVNPVSRSYLSADPRAMFDDKDEETSLRAPVVN